MQNIENNSSLAMPQIHLLYLSIYFSHDYPATTYLFHLTKTTQLDVISLPSAMLYSCIEIHMSLTLPVGFHLSLPKLHQLFSFPTNSKNPKNIKGNNKKTR